MRLSVRGPEADPDWGEMSVESARTLHEDLRHRIREYVPRQVMIDDFCIALTKERRFTASGGTILGCLSDEYPPPEREALQSDLV